LVYERLQGGLDAGHLVDGAAHVHGACPLRISEEPRAPLTVDPFPGRLPIEIGRGFGAQAFLA
jgi:hypothetical protein